MSELDRYDEYGREKRNGILEDRASAEREGLREALTECRKEIVRQHDRCRSDGDAEPYERLLAQIDAALASVPAAIEVTNARDLAGVPAAQINTSSDGGVEGHAATPSEIAVKEGRQARDGCIVKGAGFESCPSDYLLDCLKYGTDDELREVRQQAAMEIERLRNHAASNDIGRNRDPIYAPDGKTWYQTALDEAAKRGENEVRIHELETLVEQLRTALKFTTECLEGYSFARGIDPREATPESAIGQARIALSSTDKTQG